MNLKFVVIFFETKVVKMLCLHVTDLCYIVEMLITKGAGAEEVEGGGRCILSVGMEGCSI